MVRNRLKGAGYATDEEPFLLLTATSSQFSTEIDCLDPPSLFVLKTKELNICQEGFNYNWDCPSAFPSCLRSPPASTCSSWEGC